MTDTQDWRHRAACRDEDPEMFFPVAEQGPAVHQVRRAQTVCAQCPVTSECLADALDAGMTHGVWGGMSAREREPMHRRHKRGARRTQQGRKAELPQHDIELILARLDAGMTLPALEQATGIGRSVCLRVWNEHRTTKPPSVNRGGCRRAAKEVSA